MFEHVQAGAEYLLARLLAGHHAGQQQAAEALRENRPGQLRVADDLGPGALQLQNLLFGTQPDKFVSTTSIRSRFCRPWVR